MSEFANSGDPPVSGRSLHERASPQGALSDERVGLSPLLPLFGDSVTICAPSLAIRRHAATVHQFRAAREDRLEPVEDRRPVQLCSHRAHSTTSLTRTPSPARPEYRPRNHRR